MRAHPLLPRGTSTTTSAPDAVLRRIADELDAHAAARERQLDALPPATTVVAQAHRDSVRRILDAIRTAQVQLRAGTYGDCVRCGRSCRLTAVPPRPWAPVCDLCHPGRMA
jgi:RNA polymerase-binding transcription factor DksA